MARSRSVKKVNWVNVLILLFLLGSAVCLSIGFLGLIDRTETFVYAIQNLIFGAVLIISAYSLSRGTRRVWWLTIVLYILMEIVLSAYFAYEQGQTFSLVKIPIYLVIMAYMMRPRVKNWFAV